MRARSALLITAAALALPVPAGAATVESSASTGPSAEPYLIYAASKGERNRVNVSITEDRVVIVDSGAKRIRVGDTYFGKCRATSRQRVVCDPLDMEVELGGGDDSITFAPGADGKAPDRRSAIPFAFEPERDDEGEIVTAAVVLGGPGNDRLAGTRFDDYFIPGPGRDVVDARGGNDFVDDDPDGAVDRIRGGGGIDAVAFRGTAAVSVDLAAGSMRAGKVRDSLAGFEQVIGSRGADTLRGTDLGEALYGDAGRDRLDGRGGSDVLVGGEPYAGDPTEDVFVGGAGDDYLDASSTTSTVPSALDCGAGSDTVFTEADDRLDPSCELATDGPVHPSYRPRVVDRAVAWPQVGGDGNPTYALHCAGSERVTCDLPIRLRSVDGTKTYGEAAFRGQGGQTLRATVVLNEEGRAAVAAGSPLAVDVGQQGPYAFGWQQVLPRLAR